MRDVLLTLSLVVLLVLLGCPQHSALTPPPMGETGLGAVAPLSEIWEALAEGERGAASVASGIATLNGRTVTDPAWRDEPFELPLNGVAPGKLGLILLRPTAIPASTHRVLVSCFADGKLVYNTTFVADGRLKRITLDLQSDNLTVRMHNAYAGGTWPEACRWEIEAVTRPAADYGEPNNVDNSPHSNTRTLSEQVHLERMTNASFFSRDSDHAADWLDWYHIDLEGGKEYAIRSRAFSLGAWGRANNFSIYPDQGAPLFGWGGKQASHERRFICPGEGSQRLFLKFWIPNAERVAQTGTAQFGRYQFRLTGPFETPQWSTHPVATLPTQPTQLLQVISQGQPLLVASREGSLNLRVWLSSTATPEAAADWTEYLLPSAFDPALTGRAPFVGGLVQGHVMLVTNTGRLYESLNGLPENAADWRKDTAPLPCGTSPLVASSTMPPLVGYATIVDNLAQVCLAHTAHPAPDDWASFDPLGSISDLYSPLEIALQRSHPDSAVLTMRDRAAPANSFVLLATQRESDPTQWSRGTLRAFNSRDQIPQALEYWDAPQLRIKYQELTQGSPTGDSVIRVYSFHSGTSNQSNSIFANLQPATGQIFLPAPELDMDGLTVAAVARNAGQGQPPLIEILRAFPDSPTWCSYTVPCHQVPVIQYTEPGTIAALQLGNLDNHMAIAFLRPKQHEVVFARETTGW